MSANTDIVKKDIEAGFLGGGGGSASWNCGEVAEANYNKTIEVSSPFWANGFDGLDLGCDLAS
jgi:hypothetical protein